MPEQTQIFIIYCAPDKYRKRFPKYNKQVDTTFLLIEKSGKIHLLDLQQIYSHSFLFNFINSLFLSFRKHLMGKNGDRTM